MVSHWQKIEERKATVENLKTYKVRNKKIAMKKETGNEIEKQAKYVIKWNLYELYENFTISSEGSQNWMRYLKSIW